MKKIGILIIFMHLFLVFCYLAPRKAIHGVLTYWGTVYCFPMWHMSAQLFAPAGESYVEWFVENEQCEWQPLAFVPQRGHAIEKRLQFRIGQFIAYDQGGAFREEQLRLSAPLASSFRRVKYFHNGTSDTLTWVLPKLKE